MSKINPLFIYHRAFRNENTRILVIITTLVYLISPVDVIPDFIFGIGWIDDILLLIMFFSEIVSLFVEKKVLSKLKKKSK